MSICKREATNGTHAQAVHLQKQTVAARLHDRCRQPNGPALCDAHAIGDQLAYIDVHNHDQSVENSTLSKLHMQHMHAAISTTILLPPSRIDDCGNHCNQ